MSHISTPPKWINTMLRRLCKEQLLEEIEGDLLEYYKYWVLEYGAKKANKLYIWHAIKFLRPYALKRNKITHPTPIAMYKNYLIVSLRNFAKNRVYVAINAIGLGIALACCITAYLVLAYNIEFDDFHDEDKVADIYSIHSHYRLQDGRNVKSINAPVPLIPIVAQEIAGIERFCRFHREFGTVQHGSNVFNEGIAFADSTFFDMFDFPLIQGTHQNFKDRHSIFINQQMAEKYFGEEDPLGKTLDLTFINDTKIQVMVGGIVDKIPENSTFGFQSIMRFEHVQNINQFDPNDWSNWREPSTFVQLVSPENETLIEKQLIPYVKTRNEAYDQTHVTSFQLEPFKKAFSRDDTGGGYVGMRQPSAPLIVFISMAAIILLIACFNLTNTTIAMASKRLKEIGVRKAIGASKSNIMGQFIFETLIMVFIAMWVGLAMAQYIVPAFTDMWGIGLTLSDLNSINFFIAMLVLLFAASMLAGVYPAIFNGRFNPISLLKGNIKAQGTNLFTKALLTIQFALSVVVLIGGVVFMQNSKFQEGIRLGYDKDRLMTAVIQSNAEYDAIKNELIQYPKIEEVGVTDHHIAGGSYMGVITIDTMEYRVRHIGVGKNYLETVGLNLKDGRLLDLDREADQQNAVVVNKAFLDHIGTQHALNQTVTLRQRDYKIVGIVDNHINNLFKNNNLVDGKSEPTIFYPANPAHYKLLVVKSRRIEDIYAVRDELERIWEKNLPHRPFDFLFQDRYALADSKETNANLKKIFFFLTVLGAILSASGLFALASLNIEKRSKEIGIRKTLGASVSNILNLINREFAIILVLSVVLGSAGGYFLTEMLLETIYMLYIAVSIWTVLICGVFIFLIGISTTSTTIWKAAKANPIKSLRYE
jgi:putative ABC transport system permease protein